MQRILRFFQQCRGSVASPKPDFPARSYTFYEHPPPPPEEILSSRTQCNEMLINRRYTNLHDDTDTPLFELYRLYKYIMLDQHIGM